MIKIESKPVDMGLGEAMGRLNTLQSIINAGIGTKEQKAEYKLILSALNAIRLNIGFDCNNDGVPDTVEIFQQSANTGCCRLVDLPTEDRSKMRSSRG